MMEQRNELELTDKPGKRPGFLSRRFGLPVLIVCMLAALGAGFAAGRQFAVVNRVGSRVYNNKAMIDKIERLEAYMEMFYLDDIDPDKVMDGAFRGVVSGLGDPFSAYYDKEDMEDLMATDSGQYHGIGVSVYKDLSSGYIVIDEVMSEQPADKAGVEVGDLLVKIDGVSVSDLSLTDAVNKIKKSDADTVRLEIQRASQLLEMEVRKSDIEVRTVKYEMKEGQIGYISVTEFIENTDEQFIEAVDDLEQQGMKGLVLDLRDNGGGIVDTCVNMVSRIIPEGKIIAYTLDRKEKRTDFTSNSAETVDVPIIILVNKGTASASELMTGCLKDYGLARVMGTTTYGKGIVQHVYSLGDGTAIKLTAEKYYTPNGNYIHKVGIEPDIKNEYTTEEWREVKKGKKKDRQLEEALSLLKN